MASKKVNITFPNPGLLNLEIHTTHGWEKAINVVENLSPTIQKGYDRAINKFSKSLLRIVKTSLTTGKPPSGSNVYWQELAESTIERYGNHNIYYMTGLYARSVGLFQYKSRTYVGLPINRKRSSTGGITLNQLAIILEYGSSNNSEGRGYIPPRPVWGPAYQSLGGNTQLKKTILTELRSQIRSDLGIMPNQVR